MSGIIVDDGKNHLQEILFGSASPQNYYLGLVEEGTISVANTNIQLGSGLTEITGTGYIRKVLTRGTDYTIVGAIATCVQKIFTVGAGGWSNVKGYVITKTISGNDVVWAESLPLGQQGNKLQNALIKITPVITQKAYGEV